MEGRKPKWATAWAAGLFAGEGSTWCSTSATRRQVHTAVTQKSWDGAPPEVLVRFRDYVGFGTVANRPSRPEIWYWQVDSRAGVQRLYRALDRYLDGVKHAQVLRALEKYDLWEARCGAGAGGSPGSTPATG